MKAKRKAQAIVLFLLFIAGKSHAQFYKDMSVGINAGMYVYQGDLTPDPLGSFRTIKPGFSLFAKTDQSFPGCQGTNELCKPAGQRQPLQQTRIQAAAEFFFLFPGNGIFRAAGMEYPWQKL